MASSIKAIAIGVSTGGFDALEAVLSRLDANVPPILIAMHLQPGLPRLFASRVNDNMRLRAKEAETGDTLRNGEVYIGPGQKHLTIIRRGGVLVANCFDGPKVNHVAPSADVLFGSVVQELGSAAIGIVLTGIGADGAKGLLQLRQKGAPTIGQDEATCMVYGMPKVARELGAVQYELPVNQIAAKILSLL